jgi:beta-1,4-mannosyl-glycoprotein beta-1,4-N-acetylglucosaminyltransferase
MEIEFLKKINHGRKEYDFGIMCSGSVPTTDPNKLTPPRRKKVVKYLLDQGFTVHIISGWGKERDIELSKCKTILNIHGQHGEHPSTIFEHIRCNRLLYANYSVLSETCELLDPEFINKNRTLKCIPYESFFKLTKKSDVVDCFLFYNELEMLKYRLNILKDVVDYFIIVEATRTFAGKSKPLLFDISLFEELSDRIFHVIVDDFPFENPNSEEVWKNEEHQRNCIQRGLQKLQLNQDDILIFSDLDEIPDPRTLHALRNYQLNDIYSLEQDLYYCTLQNLTKDKWYYSKVMKFKDYFKADCSIDDIRFKECNVIQRGGWHLSYFGSPEHIVNKIQNFVHQEYNTPEFTDIQSIATKIHSGMDLFNRDEIKVTVMDIYSNEYLPYNWYILTKPENPLKEYYLNRCHVRSDINEHLPVLYRYSMECESIFETGVRGIVSTYAFAYGLQQNNSKVKQLLLNDIVECDTSEISALCTLHDITLECIWCNNLHLRFNEMVDLTFIDTWHVYGQLKRELAVFKNVTRKYIIMHDTTIDAVYGESIRQGMDITTQSEQSGIPFEEICKGLKPAIDEFLKENTDWDLVEQFENNNGLTILKKNNW